MRNVTHRILVILVALVVDRRKVEVLLGDIFQMELLDRVLVVLVLLKIPMHQVVVEVEEPAAPCQIQRH